MHRLFVAIDLPESVKNSIKSICSGLPDARWVDVRQLHLTLRFIGEVDDGTFDSIKKSLAEITETRFSITLQGVGYFPPKRAPRVLWIGIEDSETLTHLADKVEQVLVRGSGIEPERRKFSPHITVARFRETSASKVAGYLARNSTFRTETFPVDAFYLYSSTLTPKGAIHQREATYALK
jgi:2'-5' RNA ligase